MLRASRLELTLPPGIDEAGAGEPADAMVAAIDDRSLADAVARLDSLPPASPIAWVMPLSTSGLLAWIVARARRLRPLPIEHACDALRHAGVVEVRAIRVDGVLPLIVLGGLTS